MPGHRPHIAQVTAPRGLTVWGTDLALSAGEPRLPTPEPAVTQILFPTAATSLSVPASGTSRTSSLVASIRASVPSAFAIQAAPSPKASRIGRRSTPTGMVAAASRCAGSILVTVPAFAFSTQIDPAPVATAKGYGDSAPGFEGSECEA
jgi:hypothetical protein